MGLIANQTKHGWIKGVNRSMKPLFQDNDTEMYLTHNKGKFIVAEIFIRTLKKKKYEYMT